MSAAGGTATVANSARKVRIDEPVDVRKLGSADIAATGHEIVRDDCVSQFQLSH
jgi:hypothetical protein